MKLIFEISHLRYATPATVSRAGIIYISEKDLGWHPYVLSWIEKRPSAERAHVMILVDKYVSETLRYIRKELQTIIPISEFNMVTSLCTLLDGLLTAQNLDSNSDKDLYEQYFVFACIWAFGGALSVKDKKDYKAMFDKWWRMTWKSIKIPDSPECPTVFDYYINPDTGKFEPWKDLLEPYVFNEDISMVNETVQTEETVCTKYFMDMMIKLKQPVMLIGTAGCGKTKLVQQKLMDLNELETLSNTINFNYYTDANTLQRIIEQPLDKKGGRRYGPPGNRNMIVFIDELNMPYVDLYGTQSPIALLRQFLDYGHWYERGAKWPLREIINIQLIACMNPTAGSFTINPRAQRHFFPMAVNFPSQSSLRRIYGSIFEGHMNATFSDNVLRNFVLPNGASLAHTLTSAALDLHSKISAEKIFQKSAINFYYEFTLRHLSNVFEGLLRCNSTFKNIAKFVRLWIHESLRVYSDCMTSLEHQQEFFKLAKQICAEKFPDQAEDIATGPLYFTHFANRTDGNQATASEELGAATHPYDEFETEEKLKLVLEEALEAYNGEHPAMNLVLFKDAMAHVCRINRIINSDSGNALLVGVGGSGKQSLSRLAAFISDFQVYQITITRGYNTENFKEDLREMYRQAGLKSTRLVFLMTDMQIVDERFLVDINDLLASGNIPDLFPAEEKDEIANKLRTEVKQAGIMDISRNSCWRYFIDKVRRHLKVVLCFSPVGDMFRIRARRAPAIVNCTVINRFFDWPYEALCDVANRFLLEECFEEDMHKNVVEFMAYSSTLVKQTSEEYRLRHKRHTYSTPKSYLELIMLYKSMLHKKKKEVSEMIDRLASGIEKLKQTTSDVSALEEKLKLQQVVVKEKEEAANLLLDKVGKEKTIIEAENQKATIEETKVCQQCDCHLNLLIPTLLIDILFY